MEKWKVSFSLPEDYKDTGTGNMIQIKRECKMNMAMEYSDLMLILQSKVIFSHNEIFGEDDKTFFEDMHDEHYSYYKVKRKVLNISEKTAIIELAYDWQ